jgi:DNA-binding Xre family transcriptional regulator
MAGELDYEWRLRLRLAERGIFNSKPLVELLAERGIRLSDSQVRRMVTGKPERLNLQVLSPLCAILESTPNDVIEPVQRSGEARLERRSAAQAGVGKIVPKRARIRPPSSDQTGPATARSTLRRVRTACASLDPWPQRPARPVPQMRVPPA